MANKILLDSGLFSTDITIESDGQTVIDWSSVVDAVPYEQLTSIDVYRNGIMLQLDTYISGEAVEGGYLSVVYTDTFYPLEVGDIIGIRYKPTYVIINDNTEIATYHDSVRRALGGVPATMVSNADIDDITILGIAEAWAIRQVPNYASITDPVDSLYLRAAVINKAASLLCPICATKNKIEVKTIDTSWKKDKVDWKSHASFLEGEAIKSLQSITSVEVNTGSDASLFVVANSKRYYDTLEEL